MAKYKGNQLEFAPNPKPGYKSVKWLFGKEIEIPEEWEVKKLADIGKIVGGGCSVA